MTTTATAFANDDSEGNRFDELVWGTLSADEATAGHGSHAKLTGWWVETWLNRFIAILLPELLDTWRAEDNDGKKAGGRKPLIPNIVFIVISMLLVLEGQPVNPKTVGHALMNRLDDAAKAVLGITHLYSRDRDWYHIAYRGLHRIIDLIDGWVAPKQLMLLDERTAIKEGRDDAHTAKKRARGEQFTAILLDLIISMQPEEHQRTSVSLSVDQTSVRAGSQRRPWPRDKKTGEELPRWNKETGEEIARPVLELEAGLYPKAKGAAVKDPSGVDKFVVSEWEMAFVANIVVDTREDPTVDHTDEPPLLIRAASLGTPNKRVGEATLDLLDSMQRRGYDITRLTFDRGYNHAMSGGFHKGLLDRGIPNVQDYREEQKGITNGVGGTKFVEGDYYCPGTAPKHLDATVRYDGAKGDISENAWRADLSERWKFALHLKDVKPNGKVRLSCPALGPSATVVCPVRKSHPKAFRGKTEPGQVLDVNVPKRWQNTAVCCQDSVTIDPNEFLEETQMLRYGSDEWLAVYRTDRNTIESVNDKLKADFDIDVSSDRRMRGLAANQYVFAFKVAALNYKRIADYARDQLRKADRAERRAIITPIRPDVKVTVPNSNNISTTPVREPKKAKPTEKKLRSRDRNGWSNYRRNAKKVPTVGTPPKP